MLYNTNQSLYNILAIIMIANSMIVIIHDNVSSCDSDNLNLTFFIFVCILLIYIELYYVTFVNLHPYYCTDD